MSRLVEEGWITPADPGPTRRIAIVVAVLSLVLLLAWLLVLLRPFDGGTDERTSIPVEVADDGSASVAGRPARTEVRTRSGTRFLVVRADLDHVDRLRTDDGTLARVRVEGPVGVDPELVVVRLYAPNERGRDGELLVTLPASRIDALADDRSAGSLRALTAPMDGRIRAVRHDDLLQARLRDGWTWMLPLGLLASTIAPLWLWRRARTRFFSMRVPGPGRQLDAAPPSSVDPVGAAVLLAGARPVDAAAAFVGHVLDLVERRQVRMRRNADPHAGHVGVQLGLAHVEEEMPHDVAVTALRQVALEDGVTVEVPDDPGRVQPLPTHAREHWHAHVAARARFERASVGFAAPRVAAAAAASAAFASAGAIGAAYSPYAGGRIAGGLVFAIALPLAVALAAWARDARRWRIVARERRNERAQWVAWRRLVGTSGGPGLDPRNLPLVAATGPVDGLVRQVAPRDAVALDAVTVRTVASLRTMCEPAGADR